MSIHHSIACAFPRLACPPAQNAWIPSKEQVMQILSPVLQQPKHVVNLVNRILDGTLSEEQWQVYERTNMGTTQRNCEAIFVRHLLTVIELARYINLFVAQPDNSHRSIHPIIRQYTLNNKRAYANMKGEFPWLAIYEKRIIKHAYLAADSIICEAIWAFCNKHIQQGATMAATLARYTQWYLCHQRHIKTQHTAIKRLEPSLIAKPLIHL